MFVACAGGCGWFWDECSRSPLWISFKPLGKACLHQGATTAAILSMGCWSESGAFGRQRRAFKGRAQQEKSNVRLQQLDSPPPPHFYSPLSPRSQSELGRRGVIAARQRPASRPRRPHAAPTIPMHTFSTRGRRGGRPVHPQRAPKVESDPRAGGKGCPSGCEGEGAACAPASAVGRAPATRSGPQPPHLITIGCWVCRRGWLGRLGRRCGRIGGAGRAGAPPPAYHGWQWLTATPFSAHFTNPQAPVQGAGDRLSINAGLWTRRKQQPPPPAAASVPFGEGARSDGLGAY